MESYINPLYWLLLVLVTSCEKDVLVLPVHEPKLAISGFISLDSSYVLVSATEKNTPDTTRDPIVMLKGPQVKVVLYEDGVFFDSLQSRCVQKPYEWPFDTIMNFYVSMKKTKPGSKYRLEVSCPGYPSASAETALPLIVPIQNADTVMYQRHYSQNNIDWTDTVCYLDIKFEDPANNQNYYMPSEYEYSYSSTADSGLFLFFLQENLLFENQFDQYQYARSGSFNSRYFSDDYIDGKVASMRYYYGTLNSYGNYSFIPDDVTVRLYTISEEYYKYNQSKLKYMEAEHDPNSEPVIVYSNVTGGYGIFAGISYSEYKYSFAK